MFQAGRSTETALSKAVNLIKDQLNLKRFAIGTFMDIEGAFNHTSSEVIRRAMIRQGVPIAVVDWTCHTLGNRNITIEILTFEGSLIQDARREEYYLSCCGV